jgi:hypothetical protein
VRAPGPAPPHAGARVPRVHGLAPGPGPAHARATAPALAPGPGPAHARARVPLALGRPYGPAPLRGRPRAPHAEVPGDHQRRPSDPAGRSTVTHPPVRTARRRRADHRLRPAGGHGRGWTGGHPFGVGDPSRPDGRRPPRGGQPGDGRARPCQARASSRSDDVHQRPNAGRLAQRPRGSWRAPLRVQHLRGRPQPFSGYPWFHGPLSSRGCRCRPYAPSPRFHASHRLSHGRPWPPGRRPPGRGSSRGPSSHGPWSHGQWSHGPWWSLRRRWTPKRASHGRPFLGELLARRSRKDGADRRRPRAGGHRPGARPVGRVEVHRPAGVLHPAPDLFARSRPHPASRAPEGARPQRLVFRLFRTPRETRSAALEAALLVSVPAATYSPTQLPGQYHRRWRA